MARFFHKIQTDHLTLRKRHQKEFFFKFYSTLAIVFLISFILIFIGSLLIKSSQSFIIYEVEINLNPQQIHSRENIHKMLNSEIAKIFPRDSFSEAEYADDNWQNFLSPAAIYKINDFLKQNESRVWLQISGALQKKIMMKNEDDLLFVDDLIKKNKMRQRFNVDFFLNSNSRIVEEAGIYSALKGSFMMLMICLGVSLPIAILTAIYLEEFAKNNVFNDFIELNINNLASVPSVVYGMLGLGIFINIFDLTRSSVLVGGLTLALMSLPVIIINSRNAIAAVPGEIKENALALGASKIQTIFHHILPCSIPGIATGSILAIARAAGETAPLLIIGMIIFIVDSPTGINDVGTSLPVQIFLWTESPEPEFIAKASFAILTLLMMIAILNLIAFFIRSRFEKKW